MKARPADRQNTQNAMEVRFMESWGQPFSTSTAGLAEIDISVMTGFTRRIMFNAHANCMPAL
jgi:hypothetical protein